MIGQLALRMVGFACPIGSGSGHFLAHFVGDADLPIGGIFQRELEDDRPRLRAACGGTVRNSVREAMMMERRESSHGYREGTSGPAACRPRSE
ncbi:MAG: hypothetical protein EOS18_32910 [Mesorhizobium sp.]|nr:MAG: hypothetical protein EOS18_32910 [Mesorhizobium sp.]